MNSSQPDPEIVKFNNLLFAAQQLGFTHNGISNFERQMILKTDAAIVLCIDEKTNLKITFDRLPESAGEMISYLSPLLHRQKNKQVKQFDLGSADSGAKHLLVLNAIPQHNPELINPPDLLYIDDAITDDEKLLSKLTRDLRKAYLHIPEYKGIRFQSTNSFRDGNSYIVEFATNDGQILTTVFNRDLLNELSPQAQKAYAYNKLATKAINSTKTSMPTEAWWELGALFAALTTTVFAVMQHNPNAMKGVGACACFLAALILSAANQIVRKPIFDTDKKTALALNDYPALKEFISVEAKYKEKETQAEKQFLAAKGSLVNPQYDLADLISMAQPSVLMRHFALSKLRMQTKD